MRCPGRSAGQLQVVSTARVVTRPPGPLPRRGQEYLLLRERVAKRLGGLPGLRPEQAEPGGRGQDGPVPEGDTVYLLARRLNARLRGQVVRRSDVRVPQHATANLAGARLVETDTHGKHLLTRFTVPDQQGITLHTHLRMDGSWTVLNPGKQLPRRLTPDIRILLEFENGLSAVGMKLPVVELIPTDQEKDVVGHLGPDPLRADWDSD